ncbi:MAG: hypothetical protein H6Q89_823 [Myxococcaceae bacterium]|nr:hypothetical protein [Myxococcaceae bacterium]
MRWWILAFLAAVILLGAAGGLWWSQRPRPPPTWTAPVPRVRCPDADAPVPLLVAAAQTTPLILWAAGKVRLFVDGQPASSPPENPRRFAPGEHRLRAEAGASTLALTFRIEPFHPALFHLEETPGAGLTAVYLGAGCTSCPPPGPVALDFTRTSATDEALLGEAAAALLGGDWRAAAARLRAVQPKSRQAAAFGRLAANVYQSAGQPEVARAQLEQLAHPELAALLEAWGSLCALELARDVAPALARWNLLTERFSALLEKFALEAPGPVQLATSRLAELSSGYLDAAQRKDPLGQEETVRAGEEALAQFVRALRRSRPDDCEFQARISASF